MFKKSFVKAILIICSILAFTGIVYSFTDYYYKSIDSDGEDGFIYWEDANTEKTVQAQAMVSKSSHWILPYVRIDEYTHCKSKETDSTGKRNDGTFYMYTLRKGALTPLPEYKGKDSKTHEKTTRIWFRSPKEIRVHAKAQVCPRRDSDTLMVDVEF